ncbi:MAG: hypothetical protein E7158_03355 [Firmicutes bacterium]|nr:hypothetical protein [Bacillota bacterium]
MKLFKRKEDTQKKYYVELAKYLEVDYKKFMKMTLKETLEIRPYISEEALTRLAGGMELELEDLMYMTMKDFKCECDYLIKETMKKKSLKNESKVEEVKTEEKEETIKVVKEKKKEEQKKIETKKNIEEKEEAKVDASEIKNKEDVKSKLKKYIDNIKKENKEKENKEDKLLNPIVNKKELKSFVKENESEMKSSNASECEYRPSIKDMFKEMGKGIKWAYRKIRHLDSNESNYVLNKTVNGTINAGTACDLEPEVAIGRSL